MNCGKPSCPLIIHPLRMQADWLHDLNVNYFKQLVWLSVNAQGIASDRAFIAAAMPPSLAAIHDQMRPRRDAALALACKAYSWELAKGVNDSASWARCKAIVSSWPGCLSVLLRYESKLVASGHLPVPIHSEDCAPCQKHLVLSSC